MPVMINSKNTPFNTFTPVKLYSSECVCCHAKNDIFRHGGSTLDRRHNDNLRRRLKRVEGRKGEWGGGEEARRRDEREGQRRPSGRARTAATKS